MEVICKGFPRQILSNLKEETECKKVNASFNSKVNRFFDELGFSKDVNFK